MKKILSTLFSTLQVGARGGLLILALIASSSLWAYDFQSGDLYYNITSSSAPYTVEVTYEECLSSNNYAGLTTATIPETVTYNGTTYSVTSIGYDAFGNCSSLTSVTIGNSVTSIGPEAFSGCSSLTSITIPNSVTSIGYEAFFYCPSLTSITIPNSVTSIEFEAFFGCSSLTSVTIPNSVTSIGEEAFGYCSALTSVVWNAKNYPDSRYGSPFSGISSQITSFTFGNEVEHIPANLCYGMNNLTSITIPYSVTSIGNDAFRECSSLTSVVWNAKNYPDSRYSSPFSGISSQITSFTFGNEVEHIPANLCYGMNNLTSITIPYSVTSIGGWAFYDTGIYNDESNWENRVLYISNCLIDAKTDIVGAYTIKDGTRLIADYAFSDCSALTSITIGNSVTSIGDNAFAGCSSLTSITIPNSVTSIGNDAFSSCSSLTSVVWNAKNYPDSRYSSPFSGISSQITSFTFGNEVEHIPANLCYGMNNLTSITIPYSVTSIGDNAFAGCSSLTSITIPNSVTSIGYYAFRGCSSLCSITIPNSVTSIGGMAFYECSSLTYLSIPNSVKYEGYDYDEGGFSSILHCYNLKTLIVPADFFGVDGDEEDYQYVMRDFPYLPKKLESITINDGEMPRLAWDMIYASYKTLKTIDLATTTDVTIEEEAFKNCYKLENLMLPSQLEAVPYMAVAECVKLQSITIPATVTEIDDRAFENCRSIKSIIFEGADPAQSPARHAAASGSALTRIGNWAFYNCHQLENLTIPEGVTEVGDAAFYGCSYLTDMTLPSTVQSIGDNGFALCAKLQKIHVEATTPPTIQAKTFFDVNRQIPVYVPDNAVEAYKADPYWQEFNIIGKSNAPSAVDNISSPDADTHKLFRNGQLLILRDGKTYNIMGAEIK